jgi:hypothetical protein
VKHGGEAGDWRWVAASGRSRCDATLASIVYVATCRGQLYIKREIEHLRIPVRYWEEGLMALAALLKLVLEKIIGVIWDA